jgi:hypothetical protein
VGLGTSTPIIPSEMSSHSRTAFGNVLTRGTPFDGNELSVVWKLPYGAGGEANVYTDKATGEILTAFTSDPVSNDWEGCASAVRRNQR